MVTLYGYWRSSSSYRVRIGLHLKGVAFEQRPVHLLKDGGEHKTESFRALNPMAQVPVLAVTSEGGEVEHLVQSVAILEYLEEAYPTPQLLPTSALERARVRAAVEIVNSGIQPLQNLSVLGEVKRLGGDATDFARRANEHGLHALERLANTMNKPYLAGDAITLADVFLVPQLYSARRFGVDLEKLPRLLEIEARLAAHQAFAAAHPDQQPDAQPA
ncbi:MAG: maleylacetoacetate isomerase [Polyangiaceae bacterium]